MPPPMLKQKPRFSSDSFVLKLCKILAIFSLFLFFVYQLISKYSNCPSPPQQILIPSNLNKVHISPTNLSHLMFGLVSSVKSWKKRRAYIEAWWRPNVTRGYIILDEPPNNELLPWPSLSSPPFRVSDNTSELEEGHISPIMVRMVHAILETFREHDRGVRWYVMAFDDSILFLDNWVEVLAKYDHTKYIYIGGQSETIVLNMYFSFEMGFGGAGIALSYPLVAAMVKDLKGCIRRHNSIGSADLIIQFCVNEYGVSLTPHKGIHQIDLHGDISGLLSAHPQAPLLSLHHFDSVDPIFPSMDTFQSTKHLMKAAKYDQPRLLQQTICYHKPKNWSFSISWGYSVHIYEKIYPRSSLKRPLETFFPWMGREKPPIFMFNLRWPCETPNVFYFDSIGKFSRNQILTTYVRSSPPKYPNCTSSGNLFAKDIAKISVFSSAEKLIEVERSECCDVEHSEGTNKAEVRLRACRDDEIIA